LPIWFAHQFRPLLAIRGSRKRAQQRHQSAPRVPPLPGGRAGGGRAAGGPAGRERQPPAAARLASQLINIQHSRPPPAQAKFAPQFCRLSNERRQ